jgi:hypothetical protein
MLRKTFQNIFRRIKAHSDIGKAIVLLRASKKEDPNEKVEEKVPLFCRARAEFAELNCEPACAIAALSLADAFVSHSTGNKKKNIEQAFVLPDELLSRSIVPGVIGTLRPGYDLSSTLLMIMFYRKRICGGLDPAAGLKAAQCWLRDATWEQITETSG